MINFKEIAYGCGCHELYLFFVSLFFLQLSRLIYPTSIKAILQIIF